MLALMGLPGHSSRYTPYLPPNRTTLRRRLNLETLSYFDSNGDSRPDTRPVPRSPGQAPETSRSDSITRVPLAGRPGPRHLRACRTAQSRCRVKIEQGPRPRRNQRRTPLRCACRIKTVPARLTTHRSTVGRARAPPSHRANLRRRCARVDVARDSASPCTSHRSGRRSTLRHSVPLDGWSLHISLSSDMPRSVSVTAPHAFTRMRVPKRKRGPSTSATSKSPSCPRRVGTAP